MTTTVAPTDHIMDIITNLDTGISLADITTRSQSVVMRKVQVTKTHTGTVTITATGDRFDLFINREDGAKTTFHNRTADELAEILGRVIGR